MTKTEEISAIKKKRKNMYKIVGIIIVFLFIWATLPPLVQMWDRNDIWIAGFPLSQIGMSGIPILAIITMFVCYLQDKKMTLEIMKLKGIDPEGGDK